MNQLIHINTRKITPSLVPLILLHQPAKGPKSACCCKAFSVVKTVLDSLQQVHAAAGGG